MSQEYIIIDATNQDPRMSYRDLVNLEYQKMMDQAKLAQVQDLASRGALPSAGSIYGGNARRADVALQTDGAKLWRWIQGQFNSKSDDRPKSNYQSDMNKSNGEQNLQDNERAKQMQDGFKRHSSGGLWG